MSAPNREIRTGNRVLSSFLGRIELFNRQAAYNCTIKDISPQGARIVIDNALLIPADFYLEIPAKGLRKRVTVKWREDDELGVSFETAGDIETLARVAALEEEVRGLREQVNTLLAAMAPAAP